ncbi:polysaccharide lyase family 7 protein [Flammeovirga pacifica]|nr:polysaccharide lyase family 7 protein [Flammeovirga pacifica]
MNCTSQKVEENPIKPEVDEPSNPDADQDEDTPEEEDELELLKIIDPGLELQNFPDWKAEGTVNNSTGESNVNSGNRSAKVTKEGDQLSQIIRVNTGVEYKLSVYAKGGVTLFVQLGEEKEEVISVIHQDFAKTSLTFTSDSAYITIGARYHAQEGRFDDFAINEYNETEEPDVEQMPTDVIPSLIQWKVTLPVDKDGNDNSNVTHVDDRNRSPLEIKDGDLVDYEWSPYFHAENNEVFFRGHCAGTTTRGSYYPRSELRQRVGGGDNYWSVQKYQYLKTVLRVTHLPVVKPEVSMVQIHGPQDEPLRVQYSASTRSSNPWGLHIVYNENYKERTQIDYDLGDRLEVEVIVDQGYITCNILNLENGQRYSKQFLSEDQTGYFKVGCYTQSTKFLSQVKPEYDKDEPNDAYAEVAVQSIELKETY